MWKPDPADARPIWKQIGDYVRLLVASGRLAADTAVPSVRHSAREMGVNPATVAKAYQKLVDAGVLEVRRGEGTFVRRLPDAEVNALRNALLESAAVNFVEKAATLEIGADEAQSAIAVAWSRLNLSTTEAEND